MPRLTLAVALLAGGSAALSALGMLPGAASPFDQARSYFAAQLAGRPLSASGLDLLKRPAADWDGVILAEPSAACRGTGIYWLRDGVAAPLAITAPHGGSDRHTAAIVQRMFVEGHAAAAAFNSAPRTAGRACHGIAIDLADRTDHPFTAFALEFAARHPRGLVVQLHGFDADARALDTAVIVSNGTSSPDARVMDIADCLSRAAAPDAVSVYPAEADALGGTDNAQGKAMRAAGHDGFIHLETAPAFRTRLMNSAALRQAVGACLEGAAR